MADKRLEIVAGLCRQYYAEYAGKGYPAEFIPQAYLTQCNFGGLLMILAESNDSLVVWSDWAGDAVSESLTECEITFAPDLDADEYDVTGPNDSLVIPGFTFQNTFYPLRDCMKIEKQ